MVLGLALGGLHEHEHRPVPELSFKKEIDMQAGFAD